jgi:hypothetical protein
MFLRVPYTPGEKCIVVKDRYIYVGSFLSGGGDYGFQTKILTFIITELGYLDFCLLNRACIAPSLWPGSRGKEGRNTAVGPVGGRP